MSSEARDKNVKPYSEQCLIKDFFDFFTDIHGPSGAAQHIHANDARAYGIVSEPVNVLRVDTDHLNSNLGIRAGSKANEGSIAFMTRLGSPHAQKLLENVPKEVMANLQPKIDLYKIIYKDAADAKGTAIRLPFNNFGKPGPQTEPMPNQYISDKEGNPGHLAVSLKEFSFDYLGTNPAEVDYYINVQLKLWFSTADALFHQYPLPENVQKLFGGSKQTVSFRELIERPTIEVPTDTMAYNHVYAGTNHMAWDPKYFRIRADISYAPPNEKWLEEAAKHIYPDPAKGRKELQEALTTIKTTFFLNLLRHSFNYRPDLPTGPFELDISYVGAVETALYSQDASILRSSKDEIAVEALKSDHIRPDGKPYLSWYESMTNIGADIFKEFGVRAENLLESDFFAIKDQSANIGGVPIAFWKEKAWRNKTLLFLGRTKSGAPTSHGTLIPKASIKMSRGQNTYEREQNVDQAKRVGLVADRGTASIMQVKFANALIAYFHAKARWNLQLAERGLRDDQIKTAMYTRIFYELTGHDKVCGDATVKKKNRFYQIELPSKLVNDWLAGRHANEEASQKEQEEINRIQQDLGPNAGANRNKIDGIRKKRESRVNDPANTDSLYNKRKEIYKSLYDQLKARGTAPTTPAGLELTMPGVPLVLADMNAAQAAKDPKKESPPVEMVSLVGAFISSKLGFSRTPFGITKLNPPQRAPGQKGTHKISWIYFGDLIDATLEILRDNDRDSEKLKIDLWRAPLYSESDAGSARTYIDKGGGRTKVILGDVTYFDQISGKKKTINLADLPISFELFREFWTKKVIEPMLPRYSFLAFLKDAMTELVQAALTNKCAETGEPVVGIRPHIMQQTISKDSQLKVYAYPPEGVLDHMWRALVINSNPATFNEQWTSQDPTIVNPGSLPPETQQLVVDINAENRNEQQEIIYVCATTDTPNSFLKADKEKDIENGILYLEVGVDGTPLESISFTRRDQPYYLEAKAEQSRIKGEPLHLSEAYNCSFSLFGNNFTKPGTYVYIRLPHFGLPNVPNSPAMRLGLGGYFMITKCGNSIILRGNKMDWKTDAQCVWNSFGDINSTPRTRAFR